MTPLDRINLKLKALQEEYEDRTELLALLKSRVGQEHVASSSQHGEGLEATNTGG